MRNAGVAKMGFYPTPEESLERILDLLAPSRGAFRKGRPGPVRGEGEALRRACERLGLRPHAIELDEERAKRAKKALAPSGEGPPGGRLRLPGEGVRLPVAQPPYDWGEEGRLEEEWVRAFLPALVPGGVLVLVVPEREVARLWPRLVAAGKVRLAARLTRRDYPAFETGRGGPGEGAPHEGAAPRGPPLPGGGGPRGTALRPEAGQGPPRPREKEEPLEVFLERGQDLPLWERVEGGGSLGASGPWCP